MSAGGAPKPPLQRRGGRRALSRKPGESPDTGATGDPTNVWAQEAYDRCAWVRFFVSVCTWGRSDRRRVSARDILRCVKLTSDGGRDTAAALACGKPRAYFFIFLVFLATFLVALAVFFAFFAFFAMSSSWGWLA